MSDKCSFRPCPTEQKPKTAEELLEEKKKWDEIREWVKKAGI